MKLNKYLCFVFVLVGFLGWMVLLASCNNTEKDRSSNTAPDVPQIKDEKINVEEAAKTVGEISKSVATKADSIDNHTDQISNIIPSEIKPQAATEIKGIKAETQGLRQDSATLLATEQKLKETESRLAEEQKKIEQYTAFTKNSEDQIVKLQDKIKNLESSNGKLLQTMLAWISVACVVGIGASLVIGFVFKTPAAFLISAGCVATLGIAVAVTIYMETIAWVALSVLGVGAIGTIIYVAMQIRNRDSAVKELVHTGEITKTYLPIPVREKIFGNAVEPGVANLVQSDTTMKLVRNVRSKEKNIRGFGLAPELPKFSKSTTEDLVKTPDVQGTNTFSQETNTPKTVLG